MHHSLCIPEIVDLIFAELDADSEVFGRRRGGGRDFAALARTCKSFRDPALDFLWCEQDTITNLLKCLPSHLWKEEARDSSFLPPVFVSSYFADIVQCTTNLECCSVADNCSDSNSGLAYTFGVCPSNSETEFKIHPCRPRYIRNNRLWSSMRLPVS
ncbi:hypothetical protein K438DRAFT_1559450 [Mycena galopus ATCC 62051]|nr:hypothetical protein K438DRAFT_1559450 [Mycena galopus ATCC 62051]